MTARDPRKLAGILNYEDARKRARRTLPRSLFDYIDGGAESETTLRRNVEAFRELSFSPRMGVWAADTNLATTVVGRRLAMPIITAPCGGMRVVHPDGELAIARAAAEGGTVFVGSSASGYTLEEISKEDGPKWFQLYRMTGRPLMEELVRRAFDAGYEALVITLDTQVPGLRERDTRNGFTYTRPLGMRTSIRMSPQAVVRPAWTWRFLRAGMPFSLANTTGTGRTEKSALPVTQMARRGAEPNSPTWEEIAWVRENWRGPILLKGILSVDDAKRAVDSGAQGIVVSNHGGRQLDGAPATLDILPSIAVAVGNQLDIIFDSGIRRGSDILKALALGAKAVLVGRFVVFGLALGGAQGVRYVLDLLRSDMLRAMQLMGCTDVGDLDPGWILGATNRIYEPVTSRR